MNARAGLLLASVLGIAPFATAADTARTHTVVIEAMRYAPAALTVRAGDTIVWVNRDPFPHTVTAQDRRFNSGEIAAGARWSQTMRTRGPAPYVCTLHPGMKAAVTVE